MNVHKAGFRRKRDKARVLLAQKARTGFLEVQKALQAAVRTAAKARTAELSPLHQVVVATSAPPANGAQPWEQPPQGNAKIVMLESLQMVPPPFRAHCVL